MKKLKLKAPAGHIHGFGWMLGEVNGRLFYSDGAAMFLCQGDPPTPNCRLKEGLMQKAYESCVGKKLKATVFVKKGKQKNFIGNIVKLAVFTGGSAIQWKYYAHVKEHYRPSRWYLGKWRDFAWGRALVAKQGGKVVAVVMPHRWDGFTAKGALR